jgi:GTP-binding protein Era
MNTPIQQRCGFVAVIGAPNAGKSTLINALVGTKVTIVSPKVQTTRTIVRGIAVQDNCQIIFIDTPGIFRAKKRLERAMVAAAWGGESEADLSLFIIDASHRQPDDENRQILDALKEKKAESPDKKLILVMNKIDSVQREKLMAMAGKLNEEINFDATFMISALKEDGTKDLLKWLGARMPQGPFHFGEDQVSDMPMRLLAAEITREKLFHNLHEELPYGLTVETESWEPFDDGSVKIDQVVYIAREAHKPIIIGRGGSAIKRVGEQSRIELEEILEQRVHLKLFVKVRENWVDDPERYRLWGLDPGA